MLREHLKRSLANSQKYQKQMTEYRQEILQLGDHNKKLETVVSKKNLLGRDRLTQQLQLATNLLKEKDNKIAVSMNSMFMDVHTESHKRRGLTSQVVQIIMA